MIAAADKWGPFMDGLDPTEYRARCRCLRAVVHLSTGPRGESVAELLRHAETDPAALEPAALTLRRLDPLDYRRTLAAYATLARPYPVTRRNRPC